jgi:hypothetical protein
MVFRVLGVFPLKNQFLGGSMGQKSTGSFGIHFKVQDPFHFPWDPFHGLRIQFLLQGIASMKDPGQILADLDLDPYQTHGSYTQGW